MFNFLQEGHVTGPFFLLKIALLIILFLYIIFAFVIFNQGRSMGETVKTNFGIVINILGFLHLLIAISLFVFTLAIL
jgi:hypothetical protein